MKKRRCWYCKRVGRFGWKRRLYPPKVYECRNDRACLARVVVERDEPESSPGNLRGVE